MKLASFEGALIGRLVVVSDDMGWQVSAAEIAPTLAEAMADWDRCEAQLRGVAAFVNRGAQRYVRFEPKACQSPGCASAPAGGPAEFQRGAAVMIGPVAQGASRAEAAAAVRLFMLEVTGPAGALRAPLAVTIDALGEMWRDGRLTCAPTLEVGADLAAGEPIVLDFAGAIQSAARAAALAAGTVISLADLRTARIAKLGEGEVVRFELRDGLSRSVFGAAELTAAPATVKELA